MGVKVRERMSEWKVAYASILDMLSYPFSRRSIPPNRYLVLTNTCTWHRRCIGDDIRAAAQVHMVSSACSW
jgi:hypothetical protein